MWCQLAQAQTDIYEFKLSNGMRVIFKQDQRAPVIIHMVWYKAGGIDEFNGTTGVAHALEHMMFKGTKNLKPGEFSERVAALGGRENAFTTKDFTAYYQQVEKKYLPQVMQLEADRMSNLQIAEKEFVKEIQVIMEERRLRTDDQTPALLYEQLLAAAFIASPQRVPVIGWMGDLQTMTYEDVRHWYQRWYAPNNAVAVIVGDAQPEQVHQLAQKYYGDIPMRHLPERKPQIEPEQRGIRTVELKAPAQNPQVIMAYKVPILQDVKNDTEPYALMVLEAILNGYANSRLPRHLVREQRIADDVDTGYTPLSRGPQLFYLSGTPAKDQTLDQLEKSLRAELAELIKTGVDNSELKRVKTQLVAAQIFKRDSAFQQAMEIGIAEMSGIAARGINKILEKIDAVTAHDVQAVAKKYFIDDHLTIARLNPLPMGLPSKKNTFPSPLLKEGGHYDR